MAQAEQEDIFIEGFRGGANTDIVYELQLSLRNPDASPLDVDGLTASTFTAKKAYGSASALVSANTTNGIALDANNSIIALQLTVGHLSGVALNRETTDLLFDWDIVLDGRKIRLLKGNLTIGGDV